MIFISMADFIRQPKQFLGLIKKSGQVCSLGDLTFQIQYTKGPKNEYKFRRAIEEEKREFGAVLVNMFYRGKFKRPFQWKEDGDSEK